MRFLRRNRGCTRTTFTVVVDLNPHGLDERELAIWTATLQALRDFRPDGQGGAL